jgi:hypothetical protein
MGQKVVIFITNVATLIPTIKVLCMDMKVLKLIGLFSNSFINLIQVFNFRFWIHLWKTFMCV